jgi:hypothetical protein
MTFWEKQFVAISKSTVKRRAADPYCICLDLDSIELLDLGPNLFRCMNPLWIKMLKMDFNFEKIYRKHHQKL